MRSRFFRLFLAVGMCASAALAQKQGSIEAAAPTFTEQIAPAFRGDWTLNIEKSDFAGRPKPKMEQLNWTERGWAFAMVRADGRLYTDASVIDRDCKMIGVENDYSCEVNVVTHRHVRFVFKHGPVILRSVEIKLLENGTLEMTHTVTPAAGKPYVEKMIWERAVQEQPKTSSGASAEAELRTVMAERLKASVEENTEKIASSLADKYSQTDISGYVQDKNAWPNEFFKPLAELIKAGKFQWDVFDEKDIQEGAIAAAQQGGTSMENAPLNENKALIRGLFEKLINNKDLGALDALVSPDYVNHNDSIGPAFGAKETKNSKFLAEVFAAFPDTRVTIEDMIAEGDKVVVRNTWRGTFLGTWRGIAPTAKQVTWTGIVIWRTKNGKIAERWANVNFDEVMQKLAATPSSGNR